MFDTKWTHFGCDAGVYTSGDYEDYTFITLSYAKDYVALDTNPALDTNNENDGNDGNDGGNNNGPVESTPELSVRLQAMGAAMILGLSMQLY